LTACHPGKASRAKRAKTGVMMWGSIVVGSIVVVLPGEDAPCTLSNVGGRVSIVVSTQQGVVCKSNWIPAWKCGLTLRQHGRRFLCRNWWKAC
jgi:hypothetical protein